MSSSSGIDFKKLAAEMEARLTPEERLVRDTRRAKEAEYDKTRQQMVARFDRLVWKDPNEAPPASPRLAIGFNMRRSSSVAKRRVSSRRDASKSQRHVEKSWEKVIDVRIEVHDSHEVIRFIGGETGHEAYRLDRDFLSGLLEYEDDRLYLCAGTPGHYNACSVGVQEVVNYIIRWRPKLIPSESLEYAESAPCM